MIWEQVKERCEHRQFWDAAKLLPAPCSPFPFQVKSLTGFPPVNLRHVHKLQAS